MAGSFYQVPHPKGYSARKSQGKPYVLYKLESAG